jgi:tetratricopeptide (TPR) repeat protein
LAAVYPYRQAGENGFVYDDIAIVQDNPRVQDLSRVEEIFLTEYWNIPEMHSRLHRPLTLLSFAVEHTLWGPEPGHFHRVNIALHGLVSLMVFLLAAILFRRLRWDGPSDTPTASALLPAAAVGLLFAIHPLHSEVVAGIVGRAELLAALFSLGIICALLQGGRWRLLAAVLVPLALLSKETAVLIFPWIVVAHLYGLVPGGHAAPRSRSGGRSSGSRPPNRLRGLLRTIGWMAPGILLAAALRFYALRGLPAPSPSFGDNPMIAATLTERLATGSILFLRYLGLHLWPSPLSPDYSYPVTRLRSFADPVAWLGLALIVACSFVVIFTVCRRGRRERHGRQRPGAGARDLLGFAVAWYLIGILAVSNVFFIIGTVMAERLTYLPGVGLFVLAGLPLAGLRSHTALRWRRIWLGVGAAVVLGVAAASIPQCESRTRAWRSPHTLFEQAVKDQPESARSWAALGEVQMKEGDFTSARVSLERAVSLYGRHADALGDLLSVQQTMGDMRAAKETARRLKEVRPGDVRPYYVLALLEAREGRLEEARREAEAGLALDPSYRPLHLSLGRLAEEMGQPEQAKAHFHKALEGQPDTISVLRDLGPLLIRLACWPEAVELYRELYREQKDWRTANAFAWSLVNLARGSSLGREENLSRALEVVSHSLHIAPAAMRKYPLDTLAAIQWESGMHAAAIATLERLTQEFPWEDRYRRKQENLRARCP